ncbi:MAG: hypothetical protein PHD46_00270 [Eubacteriales bacterium]|nr:hypothetical protein [Eubacteriales bacterium]MDD4421451.1 hypothetical protein [Eubacteriales bacterium]
MQLSGKMLDRLIQAIAFIILIGVTCAFIAVVNSDDFPYTTPKDEYALNYAYTDESAD